MIEIPEVEKLLNRIQKNLLEAKLAIDKFNEDTQNRLIELGEDLSAIKKELSQPRH